MIREKVYKWGVMFTLMSCKYCRIAAKQSPAHIIYEDRAVVAFLAENSVSRGHTLVIPREHAESYTQLTDPSGFARGLQEFLKIMEKRLSPNINLVANLGQKAGQGVKHFHMHAIPRYEGEKIFEWTWYQLSEREAQEVVEEFRR